MLSDLLKSHSELGTESGPGRASLPVPRSLANAFSSVRKLHPHYHLCPLLPTHHCWELEEGR